MSVAIFPGSFDPLTLGHVDIVERGLPLFERLIIAIGHNSQKKTMFPLQERLKHMQTVFGKQSKIEIAQYEGMTIDFCKSVNASYILRGLRSGADFEFERTVAQLNKSMDEGLETIFLISRPEFAHISSTVVREIMSYGGDYSQFVPKGVKLA